MHNKGYIHLTFLDILDALVDIIGDLLPHGDAQLPLELRAEAHLACQHHPQRGDLVLHACQLLAPFRLLRLHLLGRQAR